MSSEGYSFQVGNTPWTVTKEGYLLLSQRNRGWDRCQDDNATINEVVDGDMTGEAWGGEEAELMDQGNYLLYRVSRTLLSYQTTFPCSH